LTTEQLKEIIEDEKMTEHVASGLQEQVEDGEECQNANNSSLVVNTLLNTILN